MANNDQLWIFGSRVNPNAKGGDIDLYIKTFGSDAAKINQQKINFLLKLEEAIGEQKIDLVINNGQEELPIYLVAEQQGIQIK